MVWANYSKCLRKYHPRLLRFQSQIKFSSSYCLDKVRKFENENFLATLLLPVSARDSALAVRSFNIELVQIQDNTSEELTARMRFQFWKDCLDQIFQDKPPNHPVAKALLMARRKHNLSKRWLKNLIESREERLSNRAFSNLETFEAYAEKANCSLYYLILQCLGVTDVQADHAASHLGKSEAIVNLLRGTPHLASRRIVLIPTSVLATHKVSEEDIIRGSREQKMKDVFFDIGSAAFQHLEHAKALQKDVPKAARAAFLPSVAVASFLRRLQVRDFDIFDPKLLKRNSFLPLKLVHAKLKGNFG